MPTYDERLWPPAWLWVAGWLLALSLGLAFYAALGPAWALVAVAVPGALLTWALIAAAARVRVAGGELLAGPAHVPLSCLGEPVLLDGDRARAVRGPESDPAGYHLIRGWVPEAVQLEVTDPEDPTPYWYVATRRPAELAAAIQRARTGRAGGG